MRALVVLNPRAGRGLSERVWQKKRHTVRNRLGSVHVVRPPSFDEAVATVRESLQQGTTHIACIGGDGSLQAIVNGFFENGELINPDAVILPVIAGTGSDFPRALRRRGKPGNELNIDIGQVQYTTTDGEQALRYFVNMASVGFSADVIRQLERSSTPRFLGGTLRFFIAIVQAIWKSSSPNIRISVDGGPAVSHRSRCVAIGNGHSFAGGLAITPHADPSDGIFEITSIGAAPAGWLLLRAHYFYRGAHLTLDGVKSWRGKQISLRSPDEVQVEADGELLGFLPATISCLPQKIRMWHPI